MNKVTVEHIERIDQLRSVLANNTCATVNIVAKWRWHALRELTMWVRSVAVLVQREVCEVRKRWNTLQEQKKRKQTQSVLAHTDTLIHWALCVKSRTETSWVRINSAVFWLSTLCVYYRQLPCSTIKCQCVRYICTASVLSHIHIEKRIFWLKSFHPWDLVKETQPTMKIYCRYHRVKVYVTFCLSPCTLMLQLLWFPFSSVTFFSLFTKSRHFFLCSQNASVFPGSDSSVTGTSLLLSGEKEDRTAIALFIGNLFQRSGFLRERKIQKAGSFWLNTHCECDWQKGSVKIAGQFCLSTHCDLVVLDIPFWRERDIRLLPLWILSQISRCSFRQKSLAKIWNQSHLVSWRK